MSAFKVRYILKDSEYLHNCRDQVYTIISGIKDSVKQFCEDATIIDAYQSSEDKSLGDLMKSNLYVHGGEAYTLLGFKHQDFRTIDVDVILDIHLSDDIFRNKGLKEGVTSNFLEGFLKYELSRIIYKAGNLDCLITDSISKDDIIADYATRNQDQFLTIWDGSNRHQTKFLSGVFTWNNSHYIRVWYKKDNGSIDHLFEIKLVIKSSNDKLQEILPLHPLPIIDIKLLVNENITSYFYRSNERNIARRPELLEKAKRDYQRLIWIRDRVNDLEEKESLKNKQIVEILPQYIKNKISEIERKNKVNKFSTNSKN